MGTRADFYVGRGENAEWLGSIAWDGYPSGIDGSVLETTSEADFREQVEIFFDQRDDVTRPDAGWPWPWDDSRTTDYAYALDEGRVWASCFGHGWFVVDIEDERLGERDDVDWNAEKTAVFPDMSGRKSVRFDHGSGALFLTMRAPEGGGE